MWSGVSKQTHWTYQVIEQPYRDPPQKPTSSKDFFLNLKQEINLLTLVEEPDCAGLFVLFYREL